MHYDGEDALTLMYAAATVAAKEERKATQVDAVGGPDEAKPDLFTTAGSGPRPVVECDTTIRKDSLLFRSGRYKTPQDVVDIRAAILSRVCLLMKPLPSLERDVLAKELSAAVEYAKALFGSHLMIVADAQYETPLLCEVASLVAWSSSEVKADIRSLVLDPLDPVLGPTRTSHHEHWKDIFGW